MLSAVVASVEPHSAMSVSEKRENSPAPASVDKPRNDARNARLNWSRKTDREEIKEKLVAQAHENCKSFYHTFGECATANGILVVFRCKKENQAIIDCFNRNYSEEMLERYMADKGYSTRAPEASK